METQISNLSANFRNLYGTERGSASKRNPCKDYVNERKLIRKIKSLLSDEVISKFSKIKTLGIKKGTIKRNLINIIDYKVPKLDGEEIENYIERIESSNVYACVRKIIRHRKQRLFDKRGKRTIWLYIRKRREIT